MAVIAVAAIGGLTGGCDAGPDHAFTIPVPTGTRIIEHPPAPSDARRGNTITLRRDLVIDGTGTTVDDIFLKVLDVAVAESGSIYVYDAGRFTIEEFAADGAHVHTFGGSEGQGPGDLGERGQIAIAGGSLVYVEASRLNRWDLDTRTLSLAGRLPIGTPILYAHGTDGGEVVLAFYRSLPGYVYGLGIGAFYPNGTELAHYAVVQQPGDVFFNRTDGGLNMVNTGISRGEVDVVVSRRSEVYVTRGDRYQILALDIDGKPRWALRVAWPRERLTDAGIEQGRAHAAAITDIEGLAADWPDFMPALSVAWIRPGERYERGRGYPIRVDGHGNLYVFPYVRGAPEARPVDVYSPDGELRFTGFMPDVSWIASRGDDIYGIETDPAGDQLVVRYRIDLPGAAEEIE